MRGHFSGRFDPTIAKYWNQLEGWLVTGVGRWWVLRHLPRSREQLGESRLHCNLPQTPPAKLPKLGALKVFPNSKENCRLLDIGVMLKTFANAVVDDYIMKSNGLPQLWLRNRHVEEKVPTEMTLTPILHCFILPKYIQVAKGIDPYLVDPKLNTETRLD